jgi:hypothetical protein
MALLTDMLTFKRELKFGKDISLPRQSLTFMKAVSGNYPDNYKIHETEAGLYLVLPHNKNKSLHHTHPKDTQTLWDGKEKINTYDLDIIKILQGRDKLGILLASHIRKTATYYEEEHRTPVCSVNFKVNYSTTIEGEIIWLKLGYHYHNMTRPGWTSVNLDVFRERGQKYPHVKAEIRSMDRYTFDSRGKASGRPLINEFFNSDIDYDVTLFGLLKFIQKARLDGNDFYALENLTWICPKPDFAKIPADNILPI